MASTTNRTRTMAADTHPQTTDESPTEVHVLEFDLGTDRYCVDIGYIAEIVNTDRLTPIPNSPPHVEGVMDLRGQTTTIVNLKTVFDIDDDAFGNRIIVFRSAPDADERIGWLADEVHQVQELESDAVDTSVDGGGLKGVVRREDRFVIWVDPTGVLV